MADRLLTPQQELFLAEYTNPKSPNFSNALQSAIKAGYAEDYARNITSEMPEWLRENLGRMNMLKKAERILEKTLEMEAIDSEGKVDIGILRIQNDTGKFVTSTLGKAVYSTRNEVTGADGAPLKLMFDNAFNESTLETEKHSS